MKYQLDKKIRIIWFNLYLFIQLYTLLFTNKNWCTSDLFQWYGSIHLYKSYYKDSLNLLISFPYTLQKCKWNYNNFSYQQYQAMYHWDMTWGNSFENYLSRSIELLYLHKLTYTFSFSQRMLGSSIGKYIYLKCCCWLGRKLYFDLNMGCSYKSYYWCTFQIYMMLNIRFHSNFGTNTGQKNKSNKSSPMNL